MNQNREFGPEHEWTILWNQPGMIQEGSKTPITGYTLVNNDQGIYALTDIKLVSVNGDRMLISTGQKVITVFGRVATFSNGIVELSLAVHPGAPAGSELKIQLCGVRVKYIVNESGV